jgi:hypothetical protein
MAQNRGQSRVHHEANNSTREMPRKPDSQKTFCRVQNQRGDANSPARGSRHVRRANVSAALEANVAATRRTHEQVSERDRAQDVSQDNQSPKTLHARCHFQIHPNFLPANVKVAKRVYSAPPGFRTL